MKSESVEGVALDLGLPPSAALGPPLKTFGEDFLNLRNKPKEQGCPQDAAGGKAYLDDGLDIRIAQPPGRPMEHPRKT